MIVDRPKEDIAASLRAMADELTAELARISGWWTRHIVRPEGGYYGLVHLNGTPDKEAPLSCVLMTRILWFFSAAAHETGAPELRLQADRARDYFCTHFIDRAHGGVIWSVHPDGSAENGRKQAYAQAFAIYALAMHHRMSGDAGSLSEALAIFKALESHFTDLNLAGYWEAFQADWSEIDDIRLSEKDAFAPKTMNTHLHIMEAYTELIRSAPSAEVKAASHDILSLFLERIVYPDQSRLRLFLGNDWQDESEWVSYGHDIEASWLIWEAAEALGDVSLMGKARMSALGLAASVLEHGTGPQGEVFDARRLSDGHLDTSRIWWIQAEALVGYLNAFHLSGDELYAQAAMHNWAFIKAHVIDRNGEWRSNSTLDEAVDPWWAGPWKGCYHNGRAMMESVRLIRLALAD